jgi:hypothetical protein
MLPAVTPSPALAQRCWRGAPAPRCHTFLITESGPRLGTHEAFGSVGSATALGVMVNRTSRTALGGALELSTGSEAGTYRLAIVPRYRRWLGRDAVEIGLGVAVLGEGDPAFAFKGVTGTVALSLGDLVALVLEVERRRGVTPPTAASVGVRLGSYLGPPAALLTLAVGVVRSLGAGD